MTKRIYKSVLGIPIWGIVGGSVFLIFSILYDLFVGDVNTRRFITLGVAIVILLIAVGLHLVPLKSIGKIASKQMGAN